MSDQPEFSDEVNDLSERYLRYLRGQGPLPDLGHLDSDQRNDVRQRFELLDVLADRPLGPPPRDQDPIAARLGLVSAAATGSRADHELAQLRDEAAADVPAPVRSVLDELDLEFGSDVVLDWDSPWMNWMSADLKPVAQCNVLGIPMAIFTCDDIAVTGTASEAGEPIEVGGFLRKYPDISAVTLVTRDASRAIVLNDASCHRAIDPAHGWIPAGAYITPGPFNLELRRFLDSRLPRWEPVEEVEEFRGATDVGTDASEAVQEAMSAALRGKPRLKHKQLAQASLKAIDLEALAAIVTETQAGVIEPVELPDRILALGEAAP